VRGRGAGTQTCSFFTLGSVTGAESIFAPTSAVINQTAVFLDSRLVEVAGAIYFAFGVKELGKKIKA
jgi:hypothetical protein